MNKSCETFKVTRGFENACFCVPWTLWGCGVAKKRQKNQVSLCLDGKLPPASQKLLKIIYWLKPVPSKGASVPNRSGEFEMELVPNFYLSQRLIGKRGV